MKLVSVLAARVRSHTRAGPNHPLARGRLLIRLWRLEEEASPTGSHVARETVMNLWAGRAHESSPVNAHRRTKALKTACAVVISYACLLSAS